MSKKTKTVFKTALPLLILFLIISYLLPPKASAHCPLCVAGAGAGLTLSRILGIDDSITGIWLGAFIGALSFWFQRTVSLKYKIFQGKIANFLVYTTFQILSIWSFYKFNLVTKHSDILGYDKLTFGIVIGAATFYLADILNQLIKARMGKSILPYQSIIVSMGAVALSSSAVFILINYFI
jgi:hypothetical protein